MELQQIAVKEQQRSERQATQHQKEHQKSFKVIQCEAKSSKTEQFLMAVHFRRQQVQEQQQIDDGN